VQDLRETKGSMTNTTKKCHFSCTRLQVGFILLTFFLDVLAIMISF